MSLPSIPGDTDKRHGFRIMIWDVLKELKEATATELATAMKRRVDTIRPRLTELLALGEIRDTGQRRSGGSRGPRERVFAIVHSCEVCADDEDDELFTGTGSMMP